MSLCEHCDTAIVFVRLAGRWKPVEAEYCLAAEGASGAHWLDMDDNVFRGRLAQRGDLATLLFMVEPGVRVARRFHRCNGRGVGR